MNHQMPSMPNNFSGFVPPNGQNMGGNFDHKMENGAERIPQTVRQAQNIRSTVGQVINSRAHFVSILKQWNIDVVTSAKELDETGDFISSSYIIYRAHRDYKENLSSFLQRYPDFLPQIQVIENQMQYVKGKIGLGDIKPHSANGQKTVIGHFNNGLNFSQNWENSVQNNQQNQQNFTQNTQQNSHVFNNTNNFNSHFNSQNNSQSHISNSAKKLADLKNMKNRFSNGGGVNNLA